MPTKKQLQEQLDKIKEIYEWDDDYNDDFIGSVKEREEIFKKYWGCPDIKEDYEKLQKENEKLNSNGQEQHDHYENEISNLKEENEELKKQIPKKPRKCFSQKDKACLRRVRDILGEFNADDKASDDPMANTWFADDETLKLLDRLLK